jgi:hypothetical protein
MHGCLRSLLIALALLYGGVGHSGAPVRATFALHESCSFWMVALRQGETIVFKRRLEAGVRYRLFVMGDPHAQTVRCEVQDPLGRVVAVGDEGVRETTVRFTPDEAGVYTLRLSLCAAKGTARCSMLLTAEQGDWQATVKHWSDALGRVQQAMTALEAQGVSVALVKQGLCMVGGLTSAGRAFTVGQLELGGGTHLWAAVGDSRVRTLTMRLRREDRYIEQTASGKRLTLHAVSSEGVYAPTVSLEAEGGEAFVIVALFAVKG